MEEKIIFTEAVEYLIRKSVPTPGKLILTNQKILFQKDHEFFLLTMIRRISIPEYGNLYLVDIKLSEIEKASKDEKHKHDLILFCKNGTELRFVSEKKKLDELIEAINKAVQSYNGTTEI